MKKWMALLLSLCLLIGLCACGAQKDAQNQPLEVEPPVEEPAEPAEPAEEPAAEPEAPAEEPEAPVEEPAEEPEEEEDGPSLNGIAGDADGYWYEEDAGSGEYEDGVGNQESYSYSIPAFNVDSADAALLNSQIASDCDVYVQEMLDNEAQKASLSVYSLDYEAWLNGEIASILVTAKRAESDIVEYHTYNLNVVTGAKATGADLIAALGLDEDSFTAAAQQAASDQFEALYGGMESDEFYKEQYDKTMSADAFGLTMPMYLDGSGRLCVIARIYALAGAAYYDYPLPISR